jgi:hypothetical protein
MMRDSVKPVFQKPQAANERTTTQPCTTPISVTSLLSSHSAKPRRGHQHKRLISLRTYVIILTSLATLRRIDYHAERLLKVTAIKHPEKVFRFLFDRLHREEKHSSAARQRFEAIPYELHELREPLAQIPAVAVRMVREQYDGDYSRLIHGGARLLKIVFPDFPDTFCAELRALVKAGGEANIEFVLAILPFI